MKNPLLLVLAVLSLSIACNKSELIEESAATNNLNCNNATKAVVKKLKLNETGSDFFYYLALENAPDGNATAFPSELASFLQEEGKRVDIRYNKTSLKHTYMVCPSGHIYDPANADEETMPIIEVCQATPVL
jgi:hypothetical protein